MQKSQQEIIREFDRRLEENGNPADILNDLIPVEPVPADLLAPSLHRILISERQYSCLSLNLPHAIHHWQSLTNIANSESKFDCVIACYHSEQALKLINPRKKNHWENAVPLLQGDLVVIYVRLQPDRNREEENLFLSRFKAILEQEQPALEDPEKNLRQWIKETPRYAVPVTNEFFHYGNVEAWQNIIEHFHTRHPDLKIRVFHREKPVHRISSLFKWGKVSVGDVIHFSVAGPEFKDIAKLKKYLTMGASPRYLPFIKKRLTDTLNLF